MYIYIYTHISLCIPLHISYYIYHYIIIYNYISLHHYIYIYHYISLNNDIYIYTCMCVWWYILQYLSIYIYTYVNICIYIYMYLYLYLFIIRIRTYQLEVGNLVCWQPRLDHDVISLSSPSVRPAPRTPCQVGYDDREKHINTRISPASKGFRHYIYIYIYRCVRVCVWYVLLNL